MLLKADSWKIKSPCGDQAFKLLTPLKSKKTGNVPRKGSPGHPKYNRLVEYCNSQKDAYYGRFLHRVKLAGLSNRAVITLQAFLRLIKNYERFVITTIFLLFGPNKLNWSFFITLYRQWKKTKLVESRFNEFLINAYFLLKDEKRSFSNVIEREWPTSTKGQCYISPDDTMFSEFETVTGINWRYAFDPCPWGNVWLNATKYTWPHNIAYVNPPFHLMESFYKHIEKQFKKGTLEHCLLVMPYTRYHGNPKWGGNRSKYIVRMIKYFDLKEKDDRVHYFKYAYHLPDDERYEGKYSTVALHLYLR